MGILSRFLKPSTRTFIEEAKNTTDFSAFDLLHGLAYGRWTYFYISMGVGEHWLAKKIARVIGIFPKKGKSLPAGKGMAETYHGKTLPLQTATRLVTINEPLNIPDLEQVIPYKRARSLVLQNPDHIVALQCPCRAARETPCLPMDVCLVIGEPFASFVVESHPKKSRWISQEEAVEILKAEDERGHVHHAFFKDAMLGRFYAICNCCSCCCGAIHAHQHGTPMLASSGYVARVDDDLCIGCGKCEDSCQFQAIEVIDNTSHVIFENCMGCGVCANNCPVDAMQLEQEQAKGSPLEIISLMQQAAVGHS